MSTLTIETLNQLSTEQLSQLLDTLEGSQSLSADPVNRAGVSVSRKVLVAYYVPKNVDNADLKKECSIVDGLAERDLQDYCAQCLTVQQTPTRYVALNKLPTLPNGKVSYADLPVPVQASRTSSEQQTQVSTDAQVLASILGGILGMSDVRSSDNFFEIGGDSITAIQFISKAREAGINLEVASISQSDTIGEMADSIATGSVEDELGRVDELVHQATADRFEASGLDGSQLDEFLQNFD